MTWGAGANFEASFLTGFRGRRAAAFRGRAGRRDARRDVLVAVMVISIPRRAGFIFSFYSKFTFSPGRLRPGFQGLLRKP